MGERLMFDYCSSITRTKIERNDLIVDKAKTRSNPGLFCAL
jgi:hypothetical protein